MNYICPRGQHEPQGARGIVYCTACDVEMYLNPGADFGRPPDWVPRLIVKEWP